MARLALSLIFLVLAVFVCSESLSVKNNYDQNELESLDFANGHLISKRAAFWGTRKKGVLGFLGSNARKNKGLRKLLRAARKNKGVWGLLKGIRSEKALLRVMSAAKNRGRQGFFFRLLRMICEFLRICRRRRPRPRPRPRTTTELPTGSTIAGNTGTGSTSATEGATAGSTGETTAGSTGETTAGSTGETTAGTADSTESTATATTAATTTTA